MKKLTVFTCSLILVLGLAGAAGAMPAQWEDLIDFNPDVEIGWFQSASYTHDITDAASGSFSGYLMGGNDIIWDYSLTVALYDDGGRWDSYEVALVNQSGLFGDGLYNFSYENQEFGWSIAGLLSLNLSGSLDVTIQSLYGDFYLDYSSLVATGDNGTAPVPEPATLLLLGTGLMGIVGANRKRFSKKE